MAECPPVANSRVANCELKIVLFMVKPVDYRKFVEVIHAIDLYWTLSELPG